MMSRSCFSNSVAFENDGFWKVPEVFPEGFQKVVSGPLRTFVFRKVPEVFPEGFRKPLFALHYKNIVLGVLFVPPQGGKRSRLLIDYYSIRLACCSGRVPEAFRKHKCPETVRAVPEVAAGSPGRAPGRRTQPKLSNDETTFV